MIDMYESQEAQARLERMNPDELYTHLALQGKSQRAQVVMCATNLL